MILRFKKIVYQKTLYPKTNEIEIVIFFYLVFYLTITVFMGKIVDCEVVFSGGLMSDIQSEPKTKSCPFCHELIMEEAIKCRFCKADLSSADSAESAESNEARKSEDGMSSTQAKFFYSSVVIVFAGIFFFTRSFNLAFILTGIYSFLMYLVVEKKRKN